MLFHHSPPVVNLTEVILLNTKYSSAELLSFECSVAVDDVITTTTIITTNECYIEMRR